MQNNENEIYVDLEDNSVQDYNQFINLQMKVVEKKKKEYFKNLKHQKFAIYDAYIQDLFKDKKINLVDAKDLEFFTSLNHDTQVSYIFYITALRNKLLTDYKSLARYVSDYIQVQQHHKLNIDAYMLVAERENERYKRSLGSVSNYNSAVKEIKNLKSAFYMRQEATNMCAFELSMLVDAECTFKESKGDDVDAEIKKLHQLSKEIMKLTKRLNYYTIIADMPNTSYECFIKNQIADVYTENTKYLLRKDHDNDKFIEQTIKLIKDLDKEK